jgi:hypothetical protein
VRQVAGMGCGDVDNIDLRIADEVLVRSVRPRNAESFCKCGRPCVAAGADRDNLLTRFRLEGIDEPFGDPARADHTPAERRCLDWIRYPRQGQTVGQRLLAPQLRKRNVTSWNGLNSSSMDWPSLAAPSGNGRSSRSVAFTDPTSASAVTVARARPPSDS